MLRGTSCGYANQRETNPAIAHKFDSLRESLLVGMQETLQSACPDVPEDFETQNKFFAKVERWVSSCEQYDDELTKAIALSVIPEQIVALGGSPVEQLKALLAWYK